jgi:hypothetical protein
MDKKLYTEKKVKPQAVSFIIGKNGCHIKDITNKIKNGAYVEYQIDEHKFIISAYSKDSLMKLTDALDKLEKEFDTNRKKYVEYKFVNRFVDHALVTEIIQSFKVYNHSAFVEYKGDNIFMLSNYNFDILQTMIEHIKKYDTPLQPPTELTNQLNSTASNKHYVQWIFRRDYARVMEEVSKLDTDYSVIHNTNTNTNTNTYTNTNTNKQIEGITSFTINPPDYNDQNIDEIIDNYIEPIETITEIELSNEDISYINDCEQEFITRCKTIVNPYYQISRDYISARRISDL